MKKLERLSSSKYQIRYSEEFKKHVCNEYLSGQLNKNELARKHSIGGKGYRITLWLRKFGFEDSPVNNGSIYLDNDLKQETKEEKNSIELQKKVKELEKELEDKRLQAEMYSKMIEIAEAELGISIRKKSNTK